MRLIRTVTLALSLIVSSFALAQDHHHHVKHNMVIFGESEIFASHIVYKQPHNYQVILKLKLSDADRALYLRARTQFPSDRFIYLLNEMHIAEIANATSISGTLLRYDAAGTKHEIAARIELKRDQFEIVYFDELPLSLSR